MVTVIIGVTIGFLIGFFCDDYSRVYNSIVGVIVGFLFGFLLSVLMGAGLYYSNLGVMKKRQYETNKKEVVALIDETQSNGSFFLFSGKFGEEEYYKFYTKNPDGGMNWNSLLKSYATVYEEEDIQNAYIAEIFETADEVKKKNNNIFFINICGHPRSIFTGKYAIHVPKGTILFEDNFNLDMK